MTSTQAKRNFIFALTMAGVVGCVPVREAEAPGVEAGPPVVAASPDLPAPGRYTIEPGEGRVTIRVYRAGPFAVLGHNHVITTNALEGWVDVADVSTQSQASLSVAVASFAVDTAESRAAAGPDFTSVPTEADIAGTRANMLGPRVLDAAQFPQLEVRAGLERVESGVVALQLLVSVAGYQSEFPVTATIRQAGDRMTVHSAFEVTHEVLGLAPFSVMGGALRVAEAIEVEVAVVATRQQ